MEKEADMCYATLHRVGVVLANRINSKVLRNIINYDQRGSKWRTLWKIIRKKIGISRVASERFYRFFSPEDRCTCQAFFLSNLRFLRSQFTRNRYMIYDGDLREILTFKFIRSIRIQLRKYLQSQFRGAFIINFISNSASGRGNWNQIDERNLWSWHLGKYRVHLIEFCGIKNRKTTILFQEINNCIIFFLD